MNKSATTLSTEGEGHQVIYIQDDETPDLSLVSSNPVNASSASLVADSDAGSSTLQLVTADGSIVNLASNDANSMLIGMSSPKQILFPSDSNTKQILFHSDIDSIVSCLLFLKLCCHCLLVDLGRWMLCSLEFLRLLLLLL